MREHIHADAQDEHTHQPRWDEPSRYTHGHGWRGKLNRFIAWLMG